MRRLIHILMSILCILGITLSITGCAKEQTSFDKLNENKQKEYIATYLNKEYGIENCNIKKLEVTNDTIFSKIKDYYATVSTEDEQIITLWIDNNGNIIDNYFLNQLQKPSQDLFTNIIHDAYSDVRVETSLECKKKPTKDWKLEPDINTTLKSDEIHTTIRCFAPYKYVSTMNAYTSKICSLIDEYNIDIYFYFCENPNGVDLATYNLDSYSDSYRTR